MFNSICFSTTKNQQKSAKKWIWESTYLLCDAVEIVEVMSIYFSWKSKLSNDVEILIFWLVLWKSTRDRKCLQNARPWPWSTITLNIWPAYSKMQHRVKSRNNNFRRGTQYFRLLDNFWIQTVEMVWNLLQCPLVNPAECHPPPRLRDDLKICLIKASEFLRQKSFLEPASTWKILNSTNRINWWRTTAVRDVECLLRNFGCLILDRMVWTQHSIFTSEL